MGRSPGGGNVNPLLYSCLGNLVDRGAWWATVQGVTEESDLNEQLKQQQHHGPDVESGASGRCAAARGTQDPQQRPPRPCQGFVFRFLELIPDDSGKGRPPISKVPTPPSCDKMENEEPQVWQNKTSDPTE